MVIVAIVAVILIPLTVPLALQRFYGIDAMDVLFVIIVLYGLMSLGMKVFPRDKALF